MWRERKFQVFLVGMILLVIVVVGLIGGFVGIPYPRDDITINCRGDRGDEPCEVIRGKIR